MVNYRMREAAGNKRSAKRRSNINLGRVIRTAQQFKRESELGHEFILDTLKGSISFYGMLYRFAAEDYKRRCVEVANLKGLAAKAEEVYF